jgi:hypothetical protein
MAGRSSRLECGSAQRSCLVVVGVVALIGVLAIGFLVMRYRARHEAEESSTGESAPSSSAAPAAGLPSLPTKPTPHFTDFQGCPAEGDGADRDLNRWKNRDDDASNYYPVAFEAIESLGYPKSIEREYRAKWSSADTAAIAKYEGTPVEVEGYLADAKEEGPEACNCHGADHEFHDFHIWMVASPHADRAGSVVVEATPRLRAKHPTWTVAALKAIARDGTRVRVSGWLMMDPEHPDQIGKTRGTIWEIHPIMRIEVQSGSGWKPL